MKPPSPLFVWKLVLLVIIAACAFMYFSDPMEVVFQKRDVKFIQRMDTIRFSEDELGIIFIGNSLMNTALPRTEKGLNAQLRNEFRKAGVSENITGLDMIAGNLRLSTLDRLADKLIAIQPSVIVFQSEMFVPRSSWENPPMGISQRVGTWSGVVTLKLLGKHRQALNRSGEQKDLVIQKDVPKQDENKNQVMTKKEWFFIKSKLSWQDRIVSTNHPEFLAGQRLINELTSKGIMVAIVELPVSETVAAVSTKKYFAERSDAIRSIVRPGVMHFIYPEVMPDKYFLDFRHFRPNGRDLFVEWFFPAFAQEFVKQEQSVNKIRK